MNFKIIKKTLKIVAYILLVIVLITGTAVLLVRSATVQTFLTHKIADYFSRELNTEVSIGYVDVDFFDKVRLDNVLIKDRQKDTLAYIHNLKLQIGAINLDSNKINIKDVILTRAGFHLKSLKGQEGTNLDFLIDYFSNTDTVKTQKKFLFNCKAVTMNGCSFSYRDLEDSSFTRPMVNFNDIGIRSLNGRFSNISIKGDSIMARIENLSFSEKSGFRLNELYANAKFSPRSIVADDLVLKTPYSDINSNIVFTTKSYDDYNDFIEKVLINSIFRLSKVDSRDIAFFANELYGLDRAINISGEIKGTIHEIRGRNLDLAYSGQTRFRGNVDLTGLPNIEETFIHLSVNHLETTRADLQTIPLFPFSRKELLNLPATISSLGKIKFKGDFTGFFNDFAAYGSFNTALGNIQTDISLSVDSVSDMASYQGNIKAVNFDAGVFANEKNLGNVSFDLDVIGKGMKMSTLDAQIKGVIGNIGFNQYNYKNITAEGKLRKEVFEGNFTIKEDNADVNFNGNINFSGPLPVLDFTATINTLKLSKLNLYKPEKNAEVSTFIVIQLKGSNIDNVTGNIAAINTNYIENDKKVFIESLDLIASEQNGRRTLQLFSSALDANVTGVYSYNELPNSFLSVLNRYLPSITGNKIKPSLKPQEWTYNIRVKDVKQLTDIFLPEFDLKSNFNIYGSYSSSRKHFDLNASGDHIIAYGKPLKNIYLDFNTSETSLDLKLNVASVEMADSVFLRNVELKGKALNDSIAYSFLWDNKQAIKNKANIAGVVQFTDANTMNGKFYSSELYLHDSLWVINPENRFIIDSSFVSINNLTVNSAGQKISIGGNISKRETDALIVSFSDFNISNLNTLIGKSGPVVSGFVNGSGSISNLYGKPTFNADMLFKNLVINSERLGDGSVVSVWDSRKESIAVNGRFLRGTIPTINFSGFYYPNKKDDNLDFEIDLQKTQLRLLEQYMKGIFSDIKGIASGNVFLKGSVEKPIIDGTLTLQKVGFTVDYLNTSYTFSGDVKFNKSSISFGEIILFDAKGNQAKVNGKIRHNYFKSIRLDITINADNFYCLNTSEADNSSYYGKAFVTGLIQLYGDLNNLVFDVAAKTEKGTQFNIPLANATEIGQGDFIRFVKHDSVTVKAEEYQVDLSGIQLYFDLEVTPDAEVQLIFDSKVGDIMKGRGSGNIKLEINTLGVFNMFGEYTIKEGDYLFTLLNTVNKRFKVEQGGTITWNGDPYDADINLSAVYRVRTTLYDLFQDSLAIHRKRIPVDCRFNMTDKLMNPTIKFAIDLPTVDETTRNDVKSILNAENEQDLNKQVFSLLLFNRFSNPGSNEAQSLSSASGATGSELLSNQLSNWLNQNNKYFDLGVKYRSGNVTSTGEEIAGNELEVALSTQLFNDRISIDGNVGVANNQTQNQTSNIVGDVNVEYKLSEDGKLRIKAFNESNDYRLSNNNAPYTQGVGLFYREEFENIRQLLKRYKEILKSKKKKAKEAAEKAEEKN